MNWLRIEWYYTVFRARRITLFQCTEFSLLQTQALICYSYLCTYSSSTSWRYQYSSTSDMMMVHLIVFSTCVCRGPSFRSTEKKIDSPIAENRVGFNLISLFFSRPYAIEGKFWSVVLYGILIDDPLSPHFIHDRFYPPPLQGKQR